MFGSWIRYVDRRGRTARSCWAMLVVLIGATGLAVGPSGPVEAYGVAPWANTPGPGGGTVYYYDSTGFLCGVTRSETCHFLEVAGSDWTTTRSAWSPRTGAIGGTSYNRGYGAQNTAAIINFDSSAGYAATNADAFVSSSGHGDWFLPSVQEVKDMDSSAYSTNFGELGTSTEMNSNWFYSYDSRRNSHFYDNTKTALSTFRAIRAFSKSDSTLAAMSVSGETLSPSFDPAVTEYSLT